MQVMPAFTASVRADNQASKLAAYLWRISGENLLPHPAVSLDDGGLPPALQSKNPPCGGFRKEQRRWIPAFAGMTFWQSRAKRAGQNVT